MKVLYIENAKATWLFDLRLVNPRGMKISYLLNGISEQYRFARVPKSPLDISEGGLSFVEGVFQNSKGVDVGVSLTAYGDGLVADTFSNTNNSTEFLRDLAQYAKQLGFDFPDESEIGKGFQSALTVSCNNSIARLLPSLDPIAKMIESNITTMDGKPRRIEFSGISMHSEDVGKNKAPIVFKFERKWMQPFDSNWYFSQGPLETDKHIAVLEQIEMALSS